MIEIRCFLFIQAIAEKCKQVVVKMSQNFIGAGRAGGIVIFIHTVLALEIIYGSGLEIMNKLGGFVYNYIIAVAVITAKRKIVAAIWAGNPNSHFSIPKL